MSRQTPPSQSLTSRTSIPSWRIFALWGGLSLGWEIFLALMIKLALVIGIKVAFFSDPLPKQEVAQEIANVFQNAPIVATEPSTPRAQTLKESK
jgi:hypothetical protein